MPPKNILLQNIDFNEFVEKNVLILRGFTLQIGTDYLKYVLVHPIEGAVIELWSKKIERAMNYEARPVIIKIYFIVFMWQFFICVDFVWCVVNTLSVNPTKWSITLKQSTTPHNSQTHSNNLWASNIVDPLKFAIFDTVFEGNNENVFAIHNSFSHFL